MWLINSTQVSSFFSKIPQNTVQSWNTFEHSITLVEMRLLQPQPFTNNHFHLLPQQSVASATQKIMWMVHTFPETQLLQLLCLMCAVYSCNVCWRITPCSTTARVWCALCTVAMCAEGSHLAALQLVSDVRCVQLQCTLKHHTLRQTFGLLMRHLRGCRLTIMTKCKWPSLNSWKCNSIISNMTTFLNLCQDGPNASICLKIVIKNNINANE
jgi:hypothetical protein